MLEVRDLHTHFLGDQGTVRSVDGVSLAVQDGRTLCIVGESGSGKSVTARSILQIVDPPGRIVSGQVLLRERPETLRTERLDITTLDAKGKRMRGVRGRRIAMIFQEPMASLSPVHTIGWQIGEGIALHSDADANEVRSRTLDMLMKVGIPNPERRIDAYPFQLSGGMRQRAMIAMALSCGPDLLIADEPTTALDVTTQAQILDLLRDLQATMGMAIIFITHDLGVVAEIADDVAVMYLGRVVEQAPVDDIFHAPQHPYTRALLESVPRVGMRGQELHAIWGSVPDPHSRPPGCSFHTRCGAFMPGHCDRTDPPVVTTGTGHHVRCLLYGREAAADAT